MVVSLIEMCSATSAIDQRSGLKEQHLDAGGGELGRGNRGGDTAADENHVSGQRGGHCAHRYSWGAAAQAPNDTSQRVGGLV